MYDFDTYVVLQRIEQEISKRGMTKEEFYKLSGVSSASYSQWNTGVHKPTLKKLVQIANVFDVSVDYLTGQSTKKDSPAPDEGEATQLRKDIHNKIDALSDDEFEALKPALSKLLGKE